ncbi:MAG: hypothetical protein SGJ21_16065 [Alphaproteobacteria bacterium]|nr:hypothetical protein [Alphaproteobacteria bacterium]
MKTVLVALTALASAACLEESATAPVPETPSEQALENAAGPRAVEGEIDWVAARTARAAAPVTDAAVSIQSVSPDAGPPPVPVLLPSGIVQAQNARPPALVTTEDGYFATYQTPKYDAIVNGSKQAYSTAGANASGSKEAMKFTTGEASAQLSFSRFGADYLIEFECREVDGGESCITEDEARAFGESLFVSQTQ